jgi:hypothetical protein
MKHVHGESFGISVRRALALIGLLMVLGSGSIFAQVTVSAGVVTAKAGDTVSVPITVANFINVGAISLKIGYSSTAATFVGIKNAPAGVTFTTNASNNVITLGWFDATAVTPINMTSGVLLNLRVVYNGGSSPFTFNTALSEIADGSGTVIQISYTNGSVSTLPLGITIGTVQAAVNTTATVPVTVTNFNEVGAISLKIQYDPNVLQFDSLVNAPTTMSFTKGASNGVLTIGWFDATGNSPVTIGSGKLMDLKFTYKGGTSALTVISAQSEITNGSGVAFTVQYTNGQVTVSTNTKPTFTPIAPITKKEQDTVSIVVSATDPNTGDVLVYSASGLPTGATFSPSTRAFFWIPALNTAGVYTVKFNVTDGQLTDSANAVITIVKNNIKPTFSAIAPITKKERDTVSFVVNATDPNTGDVLVYSASGLPTGATFNPSTRTFLWIPAVNTAGGYTVKFFVTDGLLKDSTNAVITITKTNLKPAFTKGLRDTTINENQALALSVAATDPNGDAVTYSLTGTVPAGAAINASTGAFTWTPTFTQSGIYTIVVRATDPSGLYDSAKAIITVMNVNRKPVLASKQPTQTLDSVTVNTLIVFKVAATDPDNEAITYTWKLNNVVVKAGPDTTYSFSSSAVGSTQKIACVFSDVSGGSDSATWSFRIVNLATEVQSNSTEVPTEFNLGQNYPNPFNPMTTIEFGLPKAATVTLEIYNVLGMKVRTLLSGEMLSAAYHTVTWDGRNDRGGQVTSGVYLYRITANNFEASMKMLLTK